MMHHRRFRVNDDIIRSDEKRIILDDNFVDERVLTMLDKRTVGVGASVHTRYTRQVYLDTVRQVELLLVQEYGWR